MCGTRRGARRSAEPRASILSLRNSQGSRYFTDLGHANLIMPLAHAGGDAWGGSLEVTREGRGGHHCPDDSPGREWCERRDQGQTSEDTPSH